MWELGMIANVNCHTYQKGYNENFAEYAEYKRVCIYHSQFSFLKNHQPNSHKKVVIAKLNNNTKTLNLSIGRKTEAQNTPKVTCEQAIKTSDQYFCSLAETLSFTSVNLR